MTNLLPPSPPRLWIVRHAAPLIAPGTCYGQLDVPADGDATLRAASTLALQLPEHLELRTSPLQRCEHLAHALCALRPDLALQRDTRLQEMNFGTWEGQTWNAIGKPALDAWTNHFALHAPGGGESLSDMLQRVHAALEQARQQHQDVVWITHAGVARCVEWLERYGPAQVPQAAEWNLPAPAWGAWATKVLQQPLRPPINS